METSLFACGEVKLVLYVHHFTLKKLVCLWRSKISAICTSFHTETSLFACGEVKLVLYVYVHHFTLKKLVCLWRGKNCAIGTPCIRFLLQLVRVGLAASL